MSNAEKPEPFKPPFALYELPNGVEFRVIDAERRALTSAFPYDKAHWLAARLNHPQPNASPESVEGEREAFEAWFSAWDNGREALDRMPDADDYEFVRTRAAWAAWQAAQGERAGLTAEDREFILVLASMIRRVIGDDHANRLLAIITRLTGAKP